jgi:hypothetical protein
MTRTSVPLLAAALLAAVLAATPLPATAAWPHDPTVNVPVCTANGEQALTGILSDGAGGAIVTWTDYRSGTNFDVYAQRISARGLVRWTADGVALCTATGNQSPSTTLVPDGAGGAIVTWQDGRSGTTDIYAQRISAAGAVQWTANGVALCTATGGQYSPTIVSDGAGGAIAAWEDIRSGTNDIYVQRISAAGTTQWTANGVALCTATGIQQSPTITSDGAGGAIVTWQDARSGTTDIYAQRISASGTVQWTADGVALCTAASAQNYPTIVPDGASGAIVTWMDFRNGANYDIYAQRILAGGTVQWTANGVALCTATGEQWAPAIATDGAGGAIVTWRDLRIGNYDIYAQRILAGGTVLWTANGLALCNATGDQTYPKIVSDDAGGAIVVWDDLRSGGNDIYAQRVSPTGAAQWVANGLALSTAIGNQQYPVIATDGAGGAIATWIDFRSANFDVYAQRVDRWGYLGAEPTIASVRDVPNDQGGRMKVSWYPSDLDAAQDSGVASYWIWRSVPPNYAATALSRGALLLDSDESGVQPAGKVISTTVEAGQTIFWEYVGSQVAAGDVGYSYVISTTSDSVGTSNPYTMVRVQARASTGSTFWNSAPDSGYSVDNLAPPTPAPFTGQYASGTATLHWAVSTAADLAEYRLHRGGTADFVPGPANLVVAQPDTGYVDAAGARYHYKLCAVDVHGNASGFSTLLPSGTVDVPGAAVPRAVFLAPPAPNPAHGATTLRFGLPRTAKVELALYDQQGRRVRSLLGGMQPAGEQTITWNGRDESGRSLPAGLYFVRLATEGRTFVSRLAVIR